MPEIENMKRIEGKLDKFIDISVDIQTKVTTLSQTFEYEKRLSEESRVEIKALDRRVKDLELYREGNKNIFKMFETMRTTIVRWAVGLVLGVGGTVAAAAAIIVQVVK